MYSCTPRNLLLFIILICIISCTKYVANNKSSSSSSASTSTGTSGTGSGATPIGTGGSSNSGGSSSSGSSSSSSSGGSTSSGSGGSTVGSGSSGTGGSGSSSGGSTSGGGTSSGGGTIGSGSSGSGGSGTGGTSIATTYIQGLNYSTVNNLVMWADSANLLGGGYYTTVNAGNVKIGVNYGSQQTLNIGTYFLSPYSFYSLIIYDGPQVTVAGTILPNGTTIPGTNRAYIRFIDLDPNTKNATMMCSAVSYADSSWFMNRHYVDHQTDTSLTQYKDVYATTSTVTFKINNQIVKSFQYAFEQGRKYTIIAMSEASGNSKYFIARHN